MGGYLIIGKNQTVCKNVTEKVFVISFLTNETNPWALVVVSMSNDWSHSCTQVVTLKEGEII